MIPGARNPQFGAAQRYRPNAVLFDGSTNYVSRGAALTGVSDGRTGILAMSVRNDVGSGGTIFANSGNNFLFDTNGGTSFRFMIYNTSGALGIQLSSSVGIAAGTAWRKILIAWDVDTAANNKVYIDDADVTVVSARVAGTNLKYATGISDWAIGALTNGTNKWQGGFANIYCALNQWLDFSTVSNRRKFFDASGNPVYLGATGSLPTGTAPAILLQNPAATFGTNSGTGGNMTVAGTLASITGP